MFPFFTALFVVRRSARTTCLPCSSLNETSTLSVVMGLGAETFMVPSFSDDLLISALQPSPAIAVISKPFAPLTL